MNCDVFIAIHHDCSSQSDDIHQHYQCKKKVATRHRSVWIVRFHHIIHKSLQVARHLNPRDTTLMSYHISTYVSRFKLQCFCHWSCNWAFVEGTKLFSTSLDANNTECISIRMNINSVVEKWGRGRNRPAWHAKIQKITSRKSKGEIRICFAWRYNAKHMRNRKRLRERNIITLFLYILYIRRVSLSKYVIRYRSEISELILSACWGNVTFAHRE